MRLFFVLLTFPALFLIVFSKILVRPYIQPTHNGELTSDSYNIIWQTGTENAKYEVVLTHPNGVSHHLPIKFLNLDLVLKTRIYKASAQRLQLGSKYTVTVFKNKENISESVIETRTVGKNFNFTVTGCGGENTIHQQNITSQMFLKDPDFVWHLGDFAYPYGHMRDIIQKGFPHYNDLMSHTPFYFVYGNHDMADYRGLKQYQDDLASFYYFDTPLNGPIVAKRIPSIGNRLNDFKTNVGLEKLSKATNYYFYYGNALFIVLDGNTWMNQEDKNLQKWLENVLASSLGKAKWRFVAIHNPPFSSLIGIASGMGRKDLSNDQIRARKFVPLFEAYGVDMVFSAHIHAYERSKPISFATGKIVPSKKEVEIGKPIYIVTGAGGAHLHSTNIKQKYGQMGVMGLSSAMWNSSYLKKYDLHKYSFSHIQIKDNRLIFRQIDEKGDEVDSLIINKPKEVQSNTNQPKTELTKLQFVKQVFIDSEHLISLEKISSNNIYLNDKKYQVDLLKLPTESPFNLYKLDKVTFEKVVPRLRHLNAQTQLYIFDKSEKKYIFAGNGQLAPPFLIGSNVPIYAKIGEQYSLAGFSKVEDKKIILLPFSLKYNESLDSYIANSLLD